MLRKEAVLFELEEERKFAVDLGQPIMALGIAQAAQTVEEMKEQSDMATLVDNVEEWSKNKGLHKADPNKQALKVFEEVGEVAAALARKDMHELKDGIGDTVVTLIILAQQNGMDLKECLAAAYDEIKDRTGKMVDGVFVKSSDLKFQTLEEIHDPNINGEINC